MELFEERGNASNGCGVAGRRVVVDVREVAEGRARGEEREEVGGEFVSHVGRWLTTRREPSRGAEEVVTGIVVKSYGRYGTARRMKEESSVVAEEMMWSIVGLGVTKVGCG